MNIAYNFSNSKSIVNCFREWIYRQILQILGQCDLNPKANAYKCDLNNIKGNTYKFKNSNVCHASYTKGNAYKFKGSNDFAKL